MHCHTHAQGGRCCPWLGVQRLLEGGSGGDGIAGTSEDGEATVAFAAWPYDMAIMLSHDLLDQDIMSHQCMAHGIAVLLPERGAALDIGEQEGDRAGGKL